MTENEMMTEDILSLLVQKEGPMTKTELLGCMRHSFGSNYRPESGRKWRFSYDWEIVELADGLGFTIKHTYKDGGVRLTHISL